MPGMTLSNQSDIGRYSKGLYDPNRTSGMADIIELLAAKQSLIEQFREQTMADKKETGEKTELPKRRRNWWRWIPILLLVGVCTGIAFLPEIVANTSLKKTVLNQAFADVNGGVQVDALSLSWFRPAKISGVTVRDEAGAEVIAIEKISTERTLWQLLIGPTTIGKIDVVLNKLNLVVEEDGTNLQKIFSEYLKPSDTSSGMKYSWGLNLTGKEIAVQDNMNQEKYIVWDVMVAANQTKNETLPSIASSFVIERKKSRGFFDCRISPNGDQPAAKISAKEVPLDVFSPLIDVYAPGLHVHTVLNADIDCTWSTKDYSDAKMTGEFKARDVLVTGKQWLGENRIEADLISGSIEGKLSETEVGIGEAGQQAGNPKIVSQIAIVRGEEIGEIGLSFSPTSGPSVAKLETKQLPASFLAPVVEMLAPGMTVNGKVTSELTANWDASKPDSGTHLSAVVVGDSVILGGDDWFGPRRIGSKTFTTTNLSASIDKDFNEIRSNGTLITTPLIVAQRDDLHPQKKESVVWSDQEVVANYDVVFNMKDDLLTVNPSIVTGKSIGLTAEGTVSDFSIQQVLDLKGTINYDVQNLIASSLGESNETMQFVGVNTKNFRAKGPLWPPLKENGEYNMALASPLTGLSEEFAFSTTVGWQQARVYGLDVVPGLIEASLSGSELLVKTHGVRLGDGKVALSPRINLASANPVISHEKGVLIDNVALNDQLSRKWLQFVSPLFADATAVKGSFSFGLNDAIKVDVGKLDGTNGKAALMFHQAQLSPGPMIQRIDGLIGTIRTIAGKGGGLALLRPEARWVNIPKQVVNIDVKDGRVFHDKLIYEIGGATIVSSGSVGMTDQSVDATLTMAVPENWVKGKPLLAGLQGESMTIAIGGTLDKPQLNGRAITDLAKKFGAGAAGNLIFDLLDKRRNKR